MRRFLYLKIFPQISNNLQNQLMLPTAHALGTENQSPFLVESRREIVALFKGLIENNQLISMTINSGAEAYITSILEIDDINNTITIDSTSNIEANQRLIEAPRVFFEGLLDRISIQFSTSSMQATMFDGHNALRCTLPSNMIRLQRREYYRINTPLSTPIICKIPTCIDTELASTVEILKFSLVDISCGGIAILDERKILHHQLGNNYDNCTIDLPLAGSIPLSIQIRNSQDIILLNGKPNRRIGCQFINLSSSKLNSIQRYIMNLERERNALLHGKRI